MLVACSAREEAVENAELQVTFDGESCIFEGPTLLKVGLVTLYFNNDSELRAGVDLLKHTGDDTIQDMIDYIGDDPLTANYPVRIHQVIRPVETVTGGETFEWEGNLEQGLHSMLCWSTFPTEGIWHGNGLEVVD